MATPAVLIKAGAAVLTAAVIAIGGYVVDERANDATQEIRIVQLENRLSKIDEIDRNVNVLNNKVDVLVQRVEDGRRYERHQ